MFPAAPYLRDQLVDQRGLQRHLCDGLLDRLTRSRDRRDRVLAIGCRPPLYAARHLESGDLALEPTDPLEGQEHGPDRLRLELAAFRQDNQVVGGCLAMAQVVAGRQKGLDRHGNPGEGVPQGDLPDFDAPPDLDLLRSRQQRDLTDLLEIEPDRVFASRQGGTLRVLGGYPGNPLRLVVDKDRGLPLICRCQASRGRRIALGDIATFSECHRVTGFLRDSCLF